MAWRKVRVGLTSAQMEGANSAASLARDGVNQPRARRIILRRARLWVAVGTAYLGGRMIDAWMQECVRLGVDDVVPTRPKDFVGYAGLEFEYRKERYVFTERKELWILRP